jgi:hypothetical protein
VISWEIVEKLGSFESFDFWVEICDLWVGFSERRSEAERRRNIQSHNIAISQSQNIEIFLKLISQLFLNLIAWNFSIYSQTISQSILNLFLKLFLNLWEITFFNLLLKKILNSSTYSIKNVIRFWQIYEWYLNQFRTAFQKNQQIS